MCPLYSGLPVGIVAFGDFGLDLGKYKKGSALRIDVEFKANNYTYKEGTKIEGYQILQTEFRSGGDLS
jgi:hypothetical protein